ncbi:hypothetical protein ABT120_57475 [Nonomuraea angiospora]|uniref:hypothetical protein n=1 Tax=Nonomuraea angiospora TaxID=46172 RepID=UPI00332BF33A
MTSGGQRTLGSARPSVLRAGPQVALTVKERDRVTGELRALGYDLPPSQANFLWLPLGHDSAPFADHCHANGVIVRAFPGEGVRVTVGLPEENAAFLTPAATWQRQQG